jgi:hypothetical protein
MVRFAVMGPFLRAHPDVKVHLRGPLKPFMGQFLGLFGIAASRIVTGPTCAGRIYIPEPPACANRGPSMIHATLLRRELQEAMHVPRDGAPPGAPSPAWALPLGQRHVLVMQRCCSRRVVNMPALMAALNGRLSGFRVVIMEPDTSLEEGMRLWHNARLVIGPHGGGMANVVVGRHPLTVIEFNVAQVGLAFQNLGIALGFAFESIMPENATQDSQMNVPVARVVEAAVRALNRQGATL